MVDTDPFARAMAPPPDETPEERAVRLRNEASAKAVSDRIDDQLNREKEELARRKRAGHVRVLLLGQSESGKSTTIKNFQIMYSPNTWKAERVTWRAVIYLNLVRSIRRILAALDDYHVSAGGASMPFVNSEALTGEAEPLHSNASNSANLDKLSESSRAPSGDKVNMVDPSPERPNIPRTRTGSKTLPFTGELLPRHLLELSMRLSPLAQIESILISSLSSPNPIQDDFEAIHLGSLNLDGGLSSTTIATKSKGEVSVSAAIWMKALKSKVSGRRESSTSIASNDVLAKEDIVGTLRACRQDMISLWNDPYVRKVLAKRRYRPQDSSGFFLDDITRLTEEYYVPSDQDVLNARLKTVGVIEHHFQLDNKDEHWTLYDVGGTRNQRHVWANFFDDVDAIIFLAPISAFNQVLSEDTSVNRIADSLLLWRSICSNRLLSKVSIVLFLNKIDILRDKLKSGIKFKEYVTSYGDRPNDVEGIATYFKNKFCVVFKENTKAERDRELYVHLTRVNDPKSTSGILHNVRNSILRKNLQKSSLL